jgi:hypothetical protein
MNAPQQIVRRTRRWIRWLRRAGFSLLFVFLLTAALIFYVYKNLANIVVWYAARTYPQMVVELKSASFVSKQRIEIHNLSLKLRDGRGQILGVEKAVIDFSLRGLRAHRIDGVNLQTPAIHFTPAAPGAFGSHSAASGTPSAPWVIGKLHVASGEFFMDGFGASVPETSLKFAADEENFQIGADAGALTELPHKLQLWDIRVAPSFAKVQPFLFAGSVQVDFTAGGLFVRNELAGVTITSLDFTMGQKFRSLLAASGRANPPVTQTGTAPGETNPWVVRSLRIFNGRAVLDDLGVELPAIAFKLDTEMKNVALSGDIRHASKQVEEVVISDLTIHSPHDPFVPVLNFELIRLRFSLAQILDQEIDEVIFDRPTIYICEELFWYADELKRRQAAAPPSAPKAAQNEASQANWRIDKFSVNSGSLVVANAGHAGVAVPFEFSTEAENLRFNDPNDLRLKLNLVIPEGDYTFPSYQLEFRQLKGDVKFGLPPGRNAKNIFQNFSAKQARWKQFTAGKLWLGVTYDRDGIYGKFGGAVYGGYVTGEFNFYMQPDTPWAGWVSGTDVNLKQITDILAPQNFQMSGPANFNVEINGLNHEIERVTGNVKTKTAGKLKIAKLDQFIADIPKSWGSIKQGTTRIALETLRDFDYTTCNGDFWYVGGRGNLTLKMRGPRGSRNFDIALHGD